KPDDIRAEHYPNFKNPGPFLSDGEVKQLHQLIAHLTYRRFREFDTTWNTFHLLRRAYDHFRPFVDYIRDVEFAGQINIHASIDATKNRYETGYPKWPQLKLPKGPNQAMQPTASRRTASLPMARTTSFQASRAAISGG